LLLYAFLEEIDTIDQEVVEAVSNEIGSEFWTGKQRRHTEQQAAPVARTVQPDPPLETMARVMFDKANVQQRISALERAIDTLGSSLKPEMLVLQEEVAYVRVLLEEVLGELRSRGGPGKKSA
jgi:hypothetical protein